MKNLIIALIFITCSTLSAAEGPFSSGSQSFSGSIHYSKFSGDIYGDTELFDFSPTYTRCTSYGTFIGFTIGIRHSKFNQQYASGISDTRWQVGGVLEKYFTFVADGDGEIVPYFKSALLFGKDDDITIVSFVADVGAIKMISETVGVEFGVKGSFDNFSRNGGSAIGLILQAGFGFKSFIF